MSYFSSRDRSNRVFPDLQNKHDSLLSSATADLTAASTGKVTQAIDELKTTTKGLIEAQILGVLIIHHFNKLILTFDSVLLFMAILSTQV